MPTIRVMSWNIKNLGPSKMSVMPDAFLDSPVGRQYCLEYIVTVLNTYGIDVLVLLEAAGSTGPSIALQLSTMLNGWEYIFSSVQRGEKRRERYIVFWRQTIENGIVGLTPQPAEDYPTSWLYSIVDDSSLKNFFNLVGWGNDRNKQIDLFNTLIISGYIQDKIDLSTNSQKDIKENSKKRGRKDKNDDDDDGPFIPPFKIQKTKNVTTTANSNLNRNLLLYSDNDLLSYDDPINGFNFIINGNKYNEISNQGKALSLIDENGVPTDLGLTTDQLKKLKDILVNINVIKFGNKYARSPFLVSFDLNNNSTTFPLLIAGIHAPNPTHKERELEEDFFLKYAAINNLTVCPALKVAPDMLIAGDFNVSYDEAVNRINTVEYAFYDVNNSPNPATQDFGFWPKDKLSLTNPFINIETGNFKAPSVLAVDKQTSFMDGKNVLKTYSVNNFKDVDFNYLGHPYDKFFFRNDKTKKDVRAVVDLIAVMNKANDTKEEDNDTKKEDKDTKVEDRVDMYNNDIALAGMRFYKSNLNESEIAEKVSMIKKKIYNKIIERYVDDEYVAGENTSVNAKRREIEYMKKLKLTEEQRKVVNMASNSLELFSALQSETVQVPANSFISFFTYAGFSDHFPIYMDIKF